MRIERNAEKDGIEIFFDDKPDETMRDRLKSNGFRFGKFKKCWYAKYTDDRWDFAVSLTGIAPIPTTTTTTETDNIADKVEAAIKYLNQLLEEI